MKIRNQLLLASIVLTFSVGSATAQHTYSKAVQKACANDYHSHCGQYGIETEALRLCMDKAGRRYRRPASTPWSMLARSARPRLSVVSELVGDTMRLREWHSPNPKRGPHG
jgi:hypothetical protein